MWEYETVYVSAWMSIFNYGGVKKNRNFIEGKS